MGMDTSQLKAFQKKLQRLREKELEQFFQKCAKELARRLLTLVIPATPTGIYPKESGKMGGTLKRGWTAETETDAKNGSGEPGTAEIAAYVDGLKVTKTGDAFYLEVVNPVFYAPYVEYGHRKRSKKKNKKGKEIPEVFGPVKESQWVEGRFMLKNSENELAQMTPRVLEAMLETFLKGALLDD